MRLTLAIHPVQSITMGDATRLEGSTLVVDRDGLLRGSPRQSGNSGRLGAEISSKSMFSGLTSSNDLGSYGGVTPSAGEGGFNEQPSARKNKHPQRIKLNFFVVIIVAPKIQDGIDHWHGARKKAPLSAGGHLINVRVSPLSRPYRHVAHYDRHPRPQDQRLR